MEVFRKSNTRLSIFSIGLFVRFTGRMEMFVLVGSFLLRGVRFWQDNDNSCRCCCSYGQPFEWPEQQQRNNPVWKQTFGPGHDLFVRYFCHDIHNRIFRLQGNCICNEINLKCQTNSVLSFSLIFLYYVLFEYFVCFFFSFFKIKSVQQNWQLCAAWPLCH